jgi:hypothetical protein
MASLFLVTGALIFSTASFIHQRNINRGTLRIMSRQVAKLNAIVARYRTGMEKIDFYDFKDNIMRMRSPVFTRIVETVFSKSREFRFNPYLVMALIQVESGFDPYAVSKSGSYGLMQINYPVWKNELNIDLQKIYKVEYNIDLGLKILSRYYRETEGDMVSALFLYNNGYKYVNDGFNDRINRTAFYAANGFN